MLASTSYVPQVTRAYTSALHYFFLILILLHRLKPLDIEIMKRLGTRVNLIPVVAKADTLTQNDLFLFKQRVRGTLSTLSSCS
jgi:septin family protein